MKEVQARAFPRKPPDLCPCCKRPLPPRPRRPLSVAAPAGMSDVALSVIFLGLLIAVGVLMFRHGDYPRQDD